VHEVILNEGFIVHEFDVFSTVDEDRANPNRKTISIPILYNRYLYR
jgi:hypothetical protein